MGLTQENPSLVNIPQEVFVNKGKTNFDSILFKAPSIINKVHDLYNYTELAHDFTTSTNEFTNYWNRFQNQWYYIQFDKGGDTLLLFMGLRESSDEREYVEIYDLKKEKFNRQIFNSVGKLVAYKVQPFTQEIILFVHEYPCCRSASHNIHTIRRINGDIHTSNRFFIGRDSGDMVGPFFPEKVKFTPEYHILTQKTEVRWSPAVVEKDAYLNWSSSNFIIHYNEGAVYKTLYNHDGWQFVLLFSGIAEEQSLVINYTNFKYKGVYGWIKS